MRLLRRMGAERAQMDRSYLVRSYDHAKTLKLASQIQFWTIIGDCTTYVRCPLRPAQNEHSQS